MEPGFSALPVGTYCLAQSPELVPPKYLSVNEGHIRAGLEVNPECSRSISSILERHRMDGLLAEGWAYLGWVMKVW